MVSENGRLDASDLNAPFDFDHLDFETTDDLVATTTPMGQDRAMDSIRFALGMDHAGYNLFASGPQGTGKHGIVTRLLEEKAGDIPASDDWIYVRNFKEFRKPRAISVPAGAGIVITCILHKKKTLFFFLSNLTINFIPLPPLSATPPP